ncbi:MAG TPA: hypothetical protein VHJ38_19440 [Nitrososphaeraceae archaeon]|nr:hypothetical protein [Nitrososphaeraceae archaeon]
MFNKNILLYVAILSTIGTATSIFQFNSVDAQSVEPLVGSNTLVITLENWGGIAGIHIDRIYNSYSETLTIADNDVDRTFISKNDNRINDLRNIIANSNFFSMGPKHGDPSDCCDLIHSTMSMSMGSKGINGTQNSNSFLE